MKLTVVFVVALALLSIASASPLLIGKHVVKKLALKAGHHAISHAIHAKILKVGLKAGLKGRSVNTIQEVHYVAHPPPIQYAPVVRTVPHAHAHVHSAYKHY